MSYDITNFSKTYEYDELPEDAKAIMDTYDENEDPYAECSRLEDEMKEIGWSFWWGLDGVPAEFFEINNK